MHQQFLDLLATRRTYPEGYSPAEDLARQSGYHFPPDSWQTLKWMIAVAHTHPGFMARFGLVDLNIADGATRVHDVRVKEDSLRQIGLSFEQAYQMILAVRWET